MRTELQERSDILANTLQRSVDACFEVLRSLGQLYQSSKQVERRDFQQFVQPALQRHLSIHALEWLPRLLDSDRLTFEQTVQREGYPDFCITERSPDGKILRAGRRAEYLPVHYVEPLESNRPALGFDLASDGTRRAALEQARDTGTIAVSGRIELVQASQHQFGFLVILPIYRQGTPCNTVSDRRQNLQGCLLGVLRLADIVRSSLAGINLDHIDFYLYDRSSSPKNGLLAAYESRTQQVTASPDLETQSPLHPSTPNPVQHSKAQHSQAICTRSFAIANRQWSLVLLPTAAYVDRVKLYQQSQMRADAATAEAESLKQALHNLQQTQARWFLEKNLIAVGVGAILLIFAVTNIFSSRQTDRLRLSQMAIERSYTVLTGLSEIRALTSDPSRLNERESGDPPTSSRAAFQQAIAQNPQQQAHLAQLDRLLHQWWATLPTPAPTTGDSYLQQQIQAILSQMEQEERSQLQQFDVTAMALMRTTRLIHATGIFLSMMLSFAVYYLLQRQATERHQVEAALYEAKNQLEMEVQERTAELNQAKEISELKLRLFSMVSHEFRTPLSTILVSSQLLSSLEGIQSEEKKAKNLIRIQSAAKTMAQLLSDILTLGRAEAGKLEFRPEWLDLLEFCPQVIDEVHISTETQQRIVFSMDGSITQAYVDGKLLHSILTNLLSNAIKYSPAHSPVHLLVCCTSEALLLQVKDEGIGIAVEDQPSLYEVFQRGKNVGEIEGTGLGLAVVKTCVELHKGHIAVNSTLGTGTTFTVTLPQ